MSKEKSAVEIAAEQEAALATGGNAALDDMLFADPRQAGDADDDGNADEAGGEGNDQAGDEQEEQQDDGAGDEPGNDDKAQQRQQDKSSDDKQADESKAARAGDEPAAGAKDEKAGDAAAAGTGTTSEEGEPTGVRLPSGKVIPYSELTQARQRAAKAEGEVSELKQTLEQLRAQVDAHAKKQGTERDEEANSTDPEDPLAGLNPDDFPETLVKAIRGVMATAKRAEARADRFEQRVNELEAPQVSREAEERQALIDQNDDLRAWQASGKGLWKDAIAVDATLLKDPAWSQKSNAERYEEVARRVREENGLPPPAAKSSAQSTGAGNGASSGNGATNPGAGQRKAAQAAKPVTSLSDIPGGAQPHVDQREALESASTASIAAQLEGKSPEQIDEWLARFGG